MFSLPAKHAKWDCWHQGTVLYGVQKRDGPTGRAKGTSHVFMGWHHIWKAAALWWVSTQKAIIRVWSSNRLDGEKCAVSARRLVITKSLPLSGNFENTVKSPLISLHLFSLIVSSFATCRFSKLDRCVLPDEPIPAVLLLGCLFIVFLQECLFLAADAAWSCSCLKHQSPTPVQSVTVRMIHLAYSSFGQSAYSSQFLCW